MSSNVNEVCIEEGYFEVTFGGLALIVNEESGYVNATQLCISKGKKASLYKRTDLYRNLKQALTKCGKDLTRRVKRNAKLIRSVRGEYFHPALLLDLAVWLSPETYVMSAVVINTFFNRTESRKLKLRSLFKFHEIAIYEHDPPNCRIRYESFDVQVDNAAWFETSDFCRANRKNVRDFEARKDLTSLVEYFRSRRLLNDTHYHPLLFLRLAGWVNVDFNAKCTRLVYCCNDDQLNSLFQSQITAAGVAFCVRPAPSLDQPTRGVAAAGSCSSDRSADQSTTWVAAAGSSSGVESTVTPSQSVTAAGNSNVSSALVAKRPTTKKRAAVRFSPMVRSIEAPVRSTSNGATEPLEPSAPSTSCGQSSLPTLSLAGVNWNGKIEEDDDLLPSGQSSLPTLSLTGGNWSGKAEENDVQSSSGQSSLPTLSLAGINFCGKPEEIDNVIMAIDPSILRIELEKELAGVRRELALAVKRGHSEIQATLAREQETWCHLEGLKRKLEDVENRLALLH